MPEENPVWDRALEERTDRAKRESAAAGPEVPAEPGPAAPQPPATQAGAVPGASPAALAATMGVSQAERAELHAPTAAEAAEARRVVLGALSRDSGSGILVAAAVIFLAAGTALIWVGTRSPLPAGDATGRRVLLDVPDVVGLSAPVGGSETAATSTDVPGLDQLDFGPEPCPADFEGPEPEI